MPLFVSFWNCTLSAGWQDKSFAERITALGAAAFNANLEARARRAALWLFVAPEYAFAGPDQGDAKPAEQVPATDETTLTGMLSALTHRYDNLLIAPGTIAVKEGPASARKARNTSHAYHGGNPVWNFSKCRGVGEVTAEEARFKLLVFRPGLGSATATVAGTLFGAEICADATGTGTLGQAVAVHVVLGQGVGAVTIQNRATQYLVVADAAAYGVYDYRPGHGGAPVASYKHEDSLGTRLYYYDLP